MVKAGDVMVNEVTGLRTSFRKTAADTGGELLQVDWIGNAGWTAAAACGTGADGPRRSRAGGVAGG